VCTVSARRAEHKVRRAGGRDCTAGVLREELVFKAHRLLYHSRVIKDLREEAPPVVLVVLRRA